MTFKTLKKYIKYGWKYLKSKGFRKKKQKISRCEAMIKSYLTYSECIFKHQFYIKLPKGIRKTNRAYIDFMVWCDGKQYAIEYNGEQHYHYIPYFHKTKAGFRKEIIMDEKKNSFCLLNKIPLIRIPYWALEELTIRDILTNKDFIVKSKHHYSYFNNGGGNK